MINALPGLNNATPASAGNANASNQADTHPVPSAGSGSVDASSPAQPPTPGQTPSFANTLQSRLKQIVQNKVPAIPQNNAPPTGHVQLLPGMALRMAAQSGIVGSDKGKASLDPTAPEKSAQTGKDARSTDSAAPPPVIDSTLGIPIPPPLALNVVVTPPAVPAAPANNKTGDGATPDLAPLQDLPAAAATVPVSATPASIAAMSIPVAVTAAPAPVVDAKSRDQARQNAIDVVQNAAATDTAAPAILAATAEKAAPPAASSDQKMESGNFQDALSRSMSHGSANPSMVPANAPPLAAAAVREVQAPMASAHWASDVGNQLTWMATHGSSRADLVLNPPELGRIEVSITVNGDQASASFVSGNPDVRDALQGSLPRLREVLADAGVFLGQANIGAESFRQNQNGAEKGGKSPDDSFSARGRTLLGSLSNPVTSATSRISQGRGMIDLFA